MNREKIIKCSVIDVFIRSSNTKAVPYLFEMGRKVKYTAKFNPMIEQDWLNIFHAYFDMNLRPQFSC